MTPRSIAVPVMSNTTDSHEESHRDLTEASVSETVHRLLLPVGPSGGFAALSATLYQNCLFFCLKKPPSLA
jgi:hypothetical protein